MTIIQLSKKLSKILFFCAHLSSSKYFLSWPKYTFMRFFSYLMLIAIRLYSSSCESYKNYKKQKPVRNTHKKTQKDRKIKFMNLKVKSDTEQVLPFRFCGFISDMSISFDPSYITVTQVWLKKNWLVSSHTLKPNLCYSCVFVNYIYYHKFEKR